LRRFDVQDVGADQKTDEQELQEPQQSAVSLDCESRWNSWYG
jgi:hypothetical protein